ncbi:hypothetical protein LZC95_18025 [Pendulispora brunnea]|uniref:Uncharacterized protein n=1 Tax=Pendulispora brunnea TaxID=2905690 RepID=A0ABZ2KRM5_9BACT
MMLRLGLAYFGAGAVLLACSSQDGNPPRIDTSLTEGRANEAPAAWTPANLPADICDIPGSTDFNVAAGESASLDPSPTCDALISQPDGLPSICVRKFANVTIAGKLTSWGDATRVLAIVATNTFAIPSGGSVNAIASGGDPRGVGGPAQGDGAGSGGAGHIGAGASGGDSAGGTGGIAFGPTSGTPVVTGSTGGYGNSQWDGLGGYAGGAIQLVACHELALSGTVDAHGENGWNGRDGYTPHVNYPGGGGGGGSGGTIVLDAPSITAGCGAKLVAVGGSGGRGGHAPELNQVGGPGGAGGTGAQPPQPGGKGGSASGGGGGAIGRIVLHLPEGAPLPSIASDPPAAMEH